MTLYRVLPGPLAPRSGPCRRHGGRGVAQRLQTLDSTNIPIDFIVSCYRCVSTKKARRLKRWSESLTVVIRFYWLWRRRISGEGASARQCYTPSIYVGCSASFRRRVPTVLLNLFHFRGDEHRCQSNQSFSARLVAPRSLGGRERG